MIFSQKSGNFIKIAYDQKNLQTMQKWQTNHPAKVGNLSSLSRMEVSSKIRQKF